MSNKKPVILCVDDDESNLKLLEALLLPRSYEVELAQSGKEALTKAEKEPDLILLDIMMPEMSGFEVLKKLRANEKTRMIPIVMVTALREVEDRVEALEAGCDDFISKPFDKLELLSRIKSLLRISYYRSLLDEKEKFENLIAEIDDGIIVLDPHLKIEKYNKRAEALINLSEEKILTDFLGHLNSNFKITLTEKEKKVIFTQGLKFDIEREETPETKPLIIEARSSLIKNPAGEVGNILIILRDVTDQRKEAQLKQDFLSLISHKLRTPIAVITQGINLFQGGSMGEMSEEQKNMLGEVEKEALSLRDLIEELLNFVMINNKKLDAKKDTIKIAEQLSELIAEFKKKKITDDFTVDLEIPDTEIILNMNPNYFNLIFYNLLDNAVKFNDKEKLVVKITVKKSDQKVEILFADNGPGIIAEEQTKVFSRFYQAEKYFTGNVKGAGLGLALVKRIVTEHGGEISLKSEPHKGATFIFTISDGKID